MFPYFYLFGRMISMYAVMAVIGCLACGILLCKNIKKMKLDDNDAIIFLLVVAVGVLVGGHLLYGITNAYRLTELSDASNIKEFFNKLFVIFSGSVFYGGLFGGIIAGYSTIRIMKLDIKIYTDIMAFLAPLFHGIARIGCFLGGCCYGIECSFGFVAHGNTIVPSVNDVSRFPVQLLESACNFILCIIIYSLYRKHKMQGRLFCIYLSSYAAIRFFDEFLRGDEIRGSVLGLSTSQFISVLVEAVLIIMFCFRLSHKYKKTGI